jgi:hypothetical protein
MEGVIVTLVLVYISGVALLIPFSVDFNSIGEAAAFIILWPVWFLREFVRGAVKLWKEKP